MGGLGKQGKIGREIKGGKPDGTPLAPRRRGTRRDVVKALKRRVYAALSAVGFQRSSTFSMVPPFVSGINFQAKKNWSAVIDAKK